MRRSVEAWSSGGLSAAFAPRLVQAIPGGDSLALKFHSLSFDIQCSKMSVGRVGVRVDTGENAQLRFMIEGRPQG
jgi:hypothetical protein